MSNVIIGGEVTIKLTKIKKVREFGKILLGLLIFLFGLFSVFYYVSAWILEVFLIFLGFFLIREVIIHKFVERKTDFVIALFLLFLGIFPLALEFRLLSFLPFAIEFEVSTFVLSMVLVAYGLFVVFENFFDAFAKKIF